jgi:hypothetical protein
MVLSFEPLGSLSFTCNGHAIPRSGTLKTVSGRVLGDLEVTADLVGVRLPDSSGDDVIWQAEVELAVRGLPILMHQQVAAHHCPVVLELPADDSDRPQPLVTTFLISELRPQSAETSRYKLYPRLLSLRQPDGIFDFQDHLEQTPDFDGTLVVDIGDRDGQLTAWAVWQSELTMPLRDYVPSGEPLADEEPPMVVEELGGEVVEAGPYRGRAVHGDAAPER